MSISEIAALNGKAFDVWLKKTSWKLSAILCPAAGLAVYLCHMQDPEVMAGVIGAAMATWLLSFLLVFIFVSLVKWRQSLEAVKKIVGLIGSLILICLFIAAMLGAVSFIGTLAPTTIIIILLVIIIFKLK
ncbi:hypothetical protein [Klebsiella quasipneumoniae]|uniref:hypothetical protein n=1 Tax=Klebsiella quasipneumoniae TaxID=1463165 RepID=UPI00070B1777|nr:hypothetical protein [Klebsiella quasipneumoniae]